MSQEGSENAVALVPREPLSEETVQAIADRVLANLRSSTQDGGTPRPLYEDPAHIAPLQETDTGELAIARGVNNIVV